jgi:hypothetical protein
VTNDLEIHFSNLNLPEPAKGFLHLVWDCIQGLDDWVDNTPTDKRSKEIVIYQTLVSLPSNHFYLSNLSSLSPLMSSLVLKWIGANELEDRKEVSECTFVWRAGYYDLVLEVVRIVHGVEASMTVAHYVAQMYGESYNDYVKEFKNA